MRALLFSLVLAACAPRAMNTSGEHPANPNATAGRTAGPPAALRPGVATLEDPEAPPAVDHSQHTAPKPEPSNPDKTDPAADRAKVDTVKDTPGEPMPVDPEKVTPQKVEPKPKTPPKKPAPRPPAKPKPEPAKPKPEPAKEPAKPPVDHSGHGGH